MIAAIREKGLLRTAKGLFSKHVFKSESLIFLKRSLSARLPEHGQKVEWVARQINWETDREKFKRDFPAKIKAFDYRISEGCLAVACFVGEQVISYVWMSEKDFFEPVYGYVFSPNPKGIYQLDGFIPQKYRNGLMSRDLQQCLWDMSLEKGYENVLSHVASDNVRSLYFHFKVNFAEKGMLLHCTKIFSKKWTKEEKYTGERFGQYRKIHD